MADHFSDYKPSLTAPAEAGEAITPSDTLDLNNVSRALYVGTSGDLRLILVDGGTITLSGVQAGTIYPVRVRRVLASGTTAGNLVGLR